MRVAHDRILGGAFALGGLALIVYTLSQSWAKNLATDPTMGAGFVPLLAAGLIVLLGLILVLKPDPKVKFQGGMLLPALLAVAGLLFAFLLNPLGYMLVGPLYLAATLWLWGWRRPVSLVAVSILMPFVAWFLFGRLLYIPLPEIPFF